MVRIQKLTGMHTWQVESIIVAFVLLTTAYISNKGWIEYLGVCAVFFSWMHASVANSLEEAQRRKYPDATQAEVSCYPKLIKYFYIKELFWCAYFFLLGAWSALAGVFIFLTYQYWRKVWFRFKTEQEALHKPRP